MGTKIAEIDNSAVWDKSLESTRVDSHHERVEDAVARAKEVATGPDADAAVVQSGTGFDVLVIPEISRLEKPGRKNSLHAGASGLVGVFAGVGAKGVRLQPTSDKSSQLDKLAGVFERAGLSAQVAEEIARSGLTPARAVELTQQLLSQPNPKLRDFGPHALALRFLVEAQAPNGARTPAQLLSRMQQFGRAVVLRPDGYLVRLLDGSPLQKAGDVTLDGGVLKAGPYELGRIYVNSGGVFFNANSALAREGGPVGELGLEHDLAGRVLDGVEAALVDTVRGVAALIRDPIRSIEGLAKLPSAVAALIQSSPAYWERFCAMPLGDQVEAVSRLTTHVALTAAGGAGIVKTVGQAGRAIGTLSIPTLSLGADGSLAYALATVNAGAAATALGSGPGTLYVLHMASSRLPDPDEVEANRAAWAKHYGEQTRVAPKTTEPATAPGAAGPSVTELPHALRKAGEIIRWLEQHGFRLDRTKGSHMQFKGPNGRMVTIANHPGEIAPGTLSSIRRQVVAAQK